MDTTNDTPAAVADQAKTAKTTLEGTCYTPIHEAAAEEESRFAIRGAQLVNRKGRRPYLVATDGRMLAVVPAGTDKCAADGTAIIPTDALKLASKVKRKGASPFPFTVADGDATVYDAKTGAKTAFRTLEGSFPPWEQVVPNPPEEPARQDDADGPEPRPFTVTVGINAEALLRLAKSLGSSTGAVKLILTLPASGNVVKKTIAVVPGAADSNDAAGASFGVIMPITANGGEVGDYRRRVSAAGVVR